MNRIFLLIRFGLCLPLIDHFNVTNKYKKLSQQTSCCFNVENLSRSKNVN